MKTCLLCNNSNWKPITEAAFKFLITSGIILECSNQEDYSECSRCGAPAREVYLLEARKITRRVVQSRVERLTHSILGSPLMSACSPVQVSVMLASVVKTAQALDQQLAETESSK